MERYKVEVIKKYVFDLDGENKEKIQEHLDYIINETKILDISYIKKDIRIKIKKINKKANLK